MNSQKLFALLQSATSRRSTALSSQESILFHRPMKSMRIKTTAGAVSLFLAGSCLAAPVTVGTGQSVKLYSPLNDGKSVTITNTATSKRLTFSGAMPAGAEDPTLTTEMVRFLGVINASLLGGPTVSVQEQFFTDYDLEETSRVGALITSPGSALTVDDRTGAFISISGYSIGKISTPNSFYQLTGGSINTNNIRISLENKTISADVQGQSLATSAYPSITTNLAGVNVWTYDKVTGPIIIPIKDLLASSNIQETLKAAGFKIWSTSADRITANAVLKFYGVRMTAQNQEVFANSLGFGRSSYYKNALASVNQSAVGIGDVTVSVMFSIPVPLR